MLLPRPVWAGCIEYGTGISLRAIYVGARSCRVVIETHSIWDDSRGGSIGSELRELNPDDGARLLRRVGRDDVADAIERAHPPMLLD